MAVQTSSWSERWDLEATLDFICSQAAERVTLQFPDSLLSSASAVAASIEQGCSHRGRPETQVPRHSGLTSPVEPAKLKLGLRLVTVVQVCVLADTTFNSMSVDEVAAQHINADCIVRADTLSHHA